MSGSSRAAIAVVVNFCYEIVKHVVKHIMHIAVICSVLGGFLEADVSHQTSIELELSVHPIPYWFCDNYPALQLLLLHARMDMLQEDTQILVPVHYRG